MHPAALYTGICFFSRDHDARHSLVLELECVDEHSRFVIVTSKLDSWVIDPFSIVDLVTFFLSSSYFLCKDPIKLSYHFIMFRLKSLKKVDILKK